MVVVLMVLALLCVVLTVLPARGLIGRNSLIGIRTRATLSSDAAWRRGHQVAILPMSVGAGAVIIVGTVLIALGVGSSTASVAVLALVLLLGGVWAAVAASRGAGDLEKH